MKHTNKICTPTLNKFGFMHPISEISKEFIKLANMEGSSLLDIGAAYGISTISCLKLGANVVACDINTKHLEILFNNTPKAFRNKLKIKCGHFPQTVNFENNSFDGILISHVLSYISPDELITGLQQSFNWLKPGGLLFIINYTPYHLALEKYIPIYENKIVNNEKWPGLIIDHRIYNSSYLSSNNLPQTIHLLDPQVLHRELSLANFSIEKLEFLNGRKNLIPCQFHLNGRELVGAIAKKV